MVRLPLEQGLRHLRRRMGSLPREEAPERDRRSGGSPKRTVADGSVLVNNIWSNQYANVFIPICRPLPISSVSGRCSARGLLRVAALVALPGLLVAVDQQSLLNATMAPPAYQAVPSRNNVQMHAYVSQTTRQLTKSIAYEDCVSDREQHSDVPQIADTAWRVRGFYRAALARGLELT